MSVVACSLPLIYLLVLETGGSKLAYTNTMYILIVFAGFTLGTRWGLITALVGGILLGPLMPLSTTGPTGPEQQVFFNWFFRLGTYSIVGLFCGLTSDSLRKNLLTITALYSHNQDTGIPNINSLSDLVNKTPSYSVKRSVVTVLVNNYDNINDLLGIEIYCKLLNKIYYNLKSQLPNGTIIVQADSNKIWISKNYEDLYSDVTVCLNLLKEPLNIEEIPLYVEFSLGIASIDNYKKCASPDAFKHCDIAARHAQKNNLPFAIFDERYLSKRGDFELLGVFPKALEENQTKLVYQPKIDLRTNEPIGLEALIRWDHPTRGLIMPDAFIPLVEETQLIHSLTDWVLVQAIKKIKDFKREDIDVNVSINISVKNLFDSRFFDRAYELVKRENVSPRQIEFEITESVLMNNPEESKVLLQRLCDHEFVISLDDFGRGYSSLAYLSEFPIQIIKIDKYFMSQIAYDQSVKYIVKATIDLAHKLGYSVVAEGIEGENVANIAKELHCDYAQGYYFAKPLHDTDVINWYKSNMQKLRNNS